MFKSICVGTIKVGDHKTVDSLRGSLMNAGCKISDWADSILGRITLSRVEKKLDLVVVSVKDLGFPNGAKYEDILKAAEKQGFYKCPAEVGPQLRLQYLDQPSDEWRLIIAMKPIKDSGGDLHLFRVFHVGLGHWLRTCSGSPDRFWLSGRRFVFVRRKYLALWTLFL